MNNDDRRRSFDRDPDAYARSRPPYPARVYEILERECGLGVRCRVLEIGAGTGQATSELLARGATVVAVEPGRQLADALTARHGDDGLTVVRDNFETAVVPFGSYHLVVAATAFHWLDTARALPKIARLLAPDGRLAVWWTVFGDPDRPTAFRAALNRVYERYLPAERRGGLPGPLRVDSWTSELQSGGWFGSIEVDVIRWSQRLTPDAARLLWGSFPNVNELPGKQRVGFLDELAGAVHDFGGLVDDPRVTVIYRAGLATSSPGLAE